MEPSTSLPQQTGRIAVLAFGTSGDVLPVAVVAAELAKSKRDFAVTFITHSAHQFLEKPLASAGVCFHPISTAPIAFPSDGIALHVLNEQSSETGSSQCYRVPCHNSNWRVSLEQKHRTECQLAVQKIFDQTDGGQDFIIFNLFALEGWHLAELYAVPCAVAAPYVVPYRVLGTIMHNAKSLHCFHLLADITCIYCAPGSFERQFRTMHPLLYKRLQNAKFGEIGWGEVMHWMWPLFTDRWTEWRSECLHLSACPLTYHTLGGNEDAEMDPVTELPVQQSWPRAPPLLYGFSTEVVECPEYWPRSIYVCGFWYAPPEWEAMYCPDDSQTLLTYSRNDYHENSRAKILGPVIPPKLLDFLSENNRLDSLPIFIGLSSSGSLGYLENPAIFLRVILKVLDTADCQGLLFTASYLPLDNAILTAAKNKAVESRNLEAHREQYSMDLDIRHLKDGIILGDNRLFCFSGSVAYNWLFPQCSMIIHHGGSGTTAAALWSGVPQIICPFLLDQFYWAERMAWIGVAPQPLRPRHLFPSSENSNFLEAVNTVLNAVTKASKAVMRDSAARLSQKLHQEDGPGNFVRLVSDQLLG